jgi:S-methylmethionine-dependent homocysteine/selenocysteine methylase
LRSGETVAEAAEAVRSLPISGMLANCCAPESITAAMAQLVATGYRHVGGYANTFVPVPSDWTLDGTGDTDGLIPLRDDLDPDPYANFARDWLAAGATVIGGCCGTGPEHIRQLAHARV